MVSEFNGSNPADWVALTDKSPEPGTECLVWYRATPWLGVRVRLFTKAAGFGEGYRVSHWIPSPVPPDSESGPERRPNHLYVVLGAPLPDQPLEEFIEVEDHRGMSVGHLDHHRADGMRYLEVGDPLAMERLALLEQFCAWVVRESAASFTTAEQRAFTKGAFRRASALDAGEVSS